MIELLPKAFCCNSPVIIQSVHNETVRPELPSSIIGLSLTLPSLEVDALSLCKKLVRHSQLAFYCSNMKVLNQHYYNMEKSFSITDYKRLSRL